MGREEKKHFRSPSMIIICYSLVWSDCRWTSSDSSFPLIQLSVRHKNLLKKKIIKKYAEINVKKKSCQAVEKKEQTKNKMRK